MLDAAIKAYEPMATAPRQATVLAKGVTGSIEANIKSADALLKTEFDKTMRRCIEHADELKSEGRLLESQQLEAPRTARTLRRRNNRLTVTDGPFAETKEFLAGFNLIEAWHEWVPRTPYPYSGASKRNFLRFP